MKLFIISTFLIISLSSLLVTNGEKPCKEFVLGALHKQVGSYFECKKTMKFKSDEDKLSKMNCILKCAMTKEGVLSADGYVDEASALAYVEREIPANLQPKALELMTKCQVHTDGLKPEEESCMSYNPLIKCAMGVLFKICE